MKKLSISLVLIAMLAVFCSVAQAQMARVRGVAKNEQGQPIQGAQVIFKNKDNGQQIKLKTGKKGDYISIAVPPGKYDVSLVQDGKELFTLNNVPVSLSQDENVIDMDLQKERGAAAAQQGAAGQAAPGQSAPAQAAAQPATGQGAQPAAGQGGQAPPQLTEKQIKALTPEQRKKLEEMQKEQAKVEAENKKIGGVNQLLAQARTQSQAGDADAAVATMKQATDAGSTYAMVWAMLGSYETDAAAKATDPAGRKQMYADSATALKKAVEICGANPQQQGCKPDQLASYHNNLGQAYAKSGQTDLAMQEYQTAAQANPAGAGQYYFNLGAILTNAGKVDDANEAFTKAIQADPTKAEAYLEKGRNLLGKGTTDKSGKTTYPPEAAQDIQKYLELQPNGVHAAEAKQILDAMGEKVTTSYGKKK